VVLLLGSGNGGTSGLVLNRRTGYLVGDLNVDSSGKGGREGGREGKREGTEWVLHRVLQTDGNSLFVAS